MSVLLIFVLIEYVKYAGLLLLLIIIQKTLIWLLAVTQFEVTPDIVLIGLVLIGINKGKITGSIAGFVSGMVLDLLSFSFIGLMAFSKATAGFIAGYFNNENKIDTYTRGYQFVLIVFFCSFVNNLIYFGIYFQGTVLTFGGLLLRYVVPTAVYTAVIAILPLVVMKRRPVVG
jgi:rod shape-determining protein MreD